MARATAEGKAQSTRRTAPAREPRGRKARPVLDALPGVEPAPFPLRVAPELATLVDVVPPGDEWVHEIKLDGYRLLARIQRGRVHLITRGEQDWTHRFERVAEALGDLPVDKAILDGEVVVLDERGVSDFQLLQNALSDGAGYTTHYFAFDLLYLDGYDLRRVPLLERKRLLRMMLGKPINGKSLIHFCDHVIGGGEPFYAQACELGLEGVISKRADRPYIAGRSREWLKTKCSRQQEFVIGGYTDPSGSRAGLGALLLGVYEGSRLIYSGKVGTGFTHESLEQLRKRLGAIARSSPAFADVPRAEARHAHWVEPKLVAEIRFTGFTQDGRLRHPAFRGLREDKRPQEVKREQPAPSKTAVRAAPRPRAPQRRR